MNLKLLILAPYRVNRCTQIVASPSSRTTSLQKVWQSTYSQVTATVPVRSSSRYPTYYLDSSFDRRSCDQALRWRGWNCQCRAYILPTYVSKAVGTSGISWRSRKHYIEWQYFWPARHDKHRISTLHRRWWVIYLSPNIQELDYFLPLTSYTNSWSQGLMHKIKYDTVVKHSFDLSLSYVLCGLSPATICWTFKLCFDYVQSVILNIFCIIKIFYT
jgi:hypothetical protein